MYSSCVWSYVSVVGVMEAVSVVVVMLCHLITWAPLPVDSTDVDESKYIPFP